MELTWCVACVVEFYFADSNLPYDRYVYRAHHFHLSGICVLAGYDSYDSHSNQALDMWKTPL